MKSIVQGGGFVCNVCNAVGGDEHNPPPNWVTFNWPPEFNKKAAHVCYNCAQAINRAMVKANVLEAIGGVNNQSKLCQSGTATSTDTTPQNPGQKPAER